MEKVSSAAIIQLADFRKDIFDRIGVPATGYCAPEKAPQSPVAKPDPQARPPKASAISSASAKAKAVAMRSIVRSMLVMATEGAFDLRAGYPDSPYLDRFDIRFAELSGRLAAVDANGLGGDFRFLAGRARTSLATLNDIVRREIIGGINRDIEIPAFDGTLGKLKNAAIAAGVAFGSLDMALKEG
ncbi:MAG: hypothetical protein IMF08_07715 [Proteobacteria bacterium]|nr:hypothetical protein [Pseudomonadota bacterium]